MFRLSCRRQPTNDTHAQQDRHPLIRFQSGPGRDGTPVLADVRRQQLAPDRRVASPRWTVHALENKAHDSWKRGRPNRVAFVVSGLKNERMMLSLNKR